MEIVELIDVEVEAPSPMLGTPMETPKDNEVEKTELSTKYVSDSRDIIGRYRYALETDMLVSALTPTRCFTPTWAFVPDTPPLTSRLLLVHALAKK